MDTIELKEHIFCECSTCLNCQLGVKFCVVCHGSTIDTTHGSLTTVCRQGKLDDTALELIREGTFDFDGIQWRRSRTITLKELLESSSSVA